MLGALTAFGSVAMAALGFLLGRFYAESERILSEKRKTYLEFLNELPPLNDTYLDATEEEFLESLRPAIERFPKLMFYADKSVLMAWGVLQQRYMEAHAALTPDSPALAPEYQALATAQNDLVLEMRRDAFRWSIFNYSGKTRVSDNLDLPNS
ncbi:hypothetical protein GTA62_20560 [Roseobacter sp. HKCCD9010]|uniref:hypothetical protein n=1 Tax=unclassified Roseobacter TaxID=196798 RepID=UPI001491595C|nr:MULTISPECIES: hypothetical protein [unclassified Roseobacter]MBF9052388.1 hypothetical protein [Rhodobacterales bacterium HKCCD4356]NNV13717.1 hypothetical protein [Roseobacter sp. HKCCD7357]NNV18555.1 hypothetical protein [Roseobacter sp. HKCCD8768]NNV28006.1 hypothetical protein [Roseobacter sp. HKCCD8192]NNV32306.1 hypothetical protein [Roseobacter sp. HKCCD9061]